MVRGKYFIAVFLLVLVIIITEALIFFFSNKPVKPPEKSVILVSPTTIPAVSRSYPFYIIGTSLTSQEVSVSKRITINFSRPLSSLNLSYEIIPFVKTGISFSKDGKELTIEPINTWGYGLSYSITIKGETKSVDGATLSSDYIIKFITPRYSGI